MTVVIEHKSGYKLCRESALVADSLKSLGQSYQIAALSQLQRDRVMTTEESLVVGSIDFIKAALRQRQMALPEVSSYPNALQPFLQRELSLSTLWEVKARVARGETLFVKPSERAKVFTGQVIQDADDWRLQRIPGREPVWCGEVVSWKSEWRYYVVCHQIRTQALYEGDPALVPEKSVVESAVQALAAIPGTPVSYAIDFGVLNSGLTALIEMNDGFSIGAYEGVDPQAYLDMLQTRWTQLTTTERKE